MPPEKRIPRGRFKVPREWLEPAEQAAVEEAKRQLGISGALPKEFQDSVIAQVQTQIADVAETVAKNAANSAVSDTTFKHRLKGNLEAGVNRVKAVAEDRQYDELVSQSASMMFKKYRALVDAGFSEEQAFNLVEAEALGKGGRTSGR